MEDSEKNKIKVKYLPEYNTKIDEFKMSKEFMLFKILTLFRHSFYNYKYNLISLNKSLKFYYSIQDELLNKDIKRWHIQRIIGGKFQNVISSAQFFIEHLKKSKRDICFQEELGGEIISVFEENELYNFLLVLRNYISHIQSLPIISRVELKKNNNLLSVLRYESLDKARIIDYLDTENKKNYRLALSYIQSSSKFINLNDVLKEYDLLLTNFYNWLISKFIAHNKNYFKNLIDKQKGIDEFAAYIGLSRELPLNKTQIRYINYLLNKF